MGGTKSRSGTCIHRKLNDNFKIIVYTRTARYIEDENGTYINKRTGKRMKKLTVGQDLSIEEIIKTLAHEIAHLKFWNHNSEHKSYTEHIIKQIRC